MASTAVSSIWMTIRAAAEIERLISDPKYAVRLAMAARAEIGKYTWETIGPKWKDLYQQLTGVRAQSSGDFA